MPAMNGLELIRELSSRYPKVKTLILTCHEDFGYVREAMNLGALDYILKLDMSEKPMIKSLDKVRKIIKEEQNQKLKEMDSIREKIAGK